MKFQTPIQENKYTKQLVKPIKEDYILTQDQI